MTVGDLLVLLAQSLFLLLTVGKLVELARWRDVARLDVALVLVSLAAGVTLRMAGPRLGVPADPYAAMAVVVHPALLLRLVQHFQPVARWIWVAVLLAVAASWALLLTGIEIGAGVLFALSTLYVLRALLRGARRAQGVVRRRMGLVAGGALVVAVVALLQAVAWLWPGAASTAIDLSQAGALLAAVLYALGLATPTWLSRAWQQSELQSFLQASAGRAGEAPAQTIQRLCQSARAAVGGQVATTARWDEERSRLELELRGQRALVGGPLPADGLIARQWTFRRPFVIDDRSAVRDACLRMAPGLDCGAIFGVPLITPARVYGLLIVFLRRGPVLPADDLRLLALLSEHTAVILDYAELVDGLRREIAVLRGDPVPDDTPLDES